MLLQAVFLVHFGVYVVSLDFAFGPTAKIRRIFFAEGSQLHFKKSLQPFAKDTF